MLYEDWIYAINTMLYQRDRQILQDCFKTPEELDEFLLEHFKKDTPLQKIVDSLDRT